MNFEEYEKRIKEFDMYPDGIKPTIYILGAFGELGEISNKFKKVFRDHAGQLEERPREYAMEIGDVIWYLTRLANSLGFSMEEILEWNYEKLDSRFKRGKIHGDGDDR